MVGLRGCTGTYASDLLGLSESVIKLDEIVLPTGIHRKSDVVECVKRESGYELIASDSRHYCIVEVKNVTLSFRDVCESHQSSQGLSRVLETNHVLI